MQDNIVVKKNLNELKNRAHKRNISYACNPKSENDVKSENDFFKMMKKQIYTQITRS